MAPAIVRALRPTLLLCALTLPAAAAEGTPRVELLIPEAGCEAPPMLPTVALRQVQAPEAATPPPFRRALLTCAALAEGPAKRPLRRT